MSDDSEAGFAERVATAFAFLTARGFARQVAPGPDVRFTSVAGVFVDVFHAPFEGYTGFRVGLLARPQDVVTNEELDTIEAGRRSRGADPGPRPGGVLEALAHLLETLGDRALAGRPDVYQEAREQRQRDM